VVMDTLGIDVGASESDNMKTFKKMTLDTKAFTYGGLVVWFQMMSKLSDCRRVCAAEYAHRLVVEDEMDQGRYWLKAEKEDRSFMKKAHCQVLMEFGLDREVRLPFIGTPVEQVPARPFAAGAGRIIVRIYFPSNASKGGYSRRNLG
jgi:hypothetical protein